MNNNYGYQGGAYGHAGAYPVAAAPAYNYANSAYDYRAAVATTAIVAGTAAAVGAAAGAAAATPAPVTAVNVLPCTASPVYAGNGTYFRCASTWYTPAYVGGGVSYVVTASPPGY